MVDLPHLKLITNSDLSGGADWGIAWLIAENHDADAACQ